MSKKLKELNGELFQAVREGDDDQIRQLLNQGANINARDNWNSYGRCTPLHVDAHCGYVNCVELLLDKGSSIKARDSDGYTVLHASARGGQSKCIEILVNRGADVHAKSDSGLTILQRAVLSGNTEFIERIINLGVDINAKNMYGETAYDLAIKSKNTDTAELIQQLSDARGQPPIENAKPHTEPRPSNDVDESPRNKRPRHCIRCECKTCTERDNVMHQENNTIKQKMSDMKDQLKSIKNIEPENATLKQKISDMEDQLKSIKGIEHENSTLKQTMSSMEDQLKSMNSLQRENSTLKRKMSDMEDRLKSLEERETETGGLPLVVTTMAGFDRKDVMGKGNINYIILSNTYCFYC